MLTHDPLVRTVDSEPETVASYLTVMTALAVITAMHYQLRRSRCVCVVGERVLRTLSRPRALTSGATWTRFSLTGDQLEIVPRNSSGRPAETTR